MANPTTNYGFVLPTSTDLVTDLPADFDVALQGVDTRLKALQPGTTLGDLAYSSATANTNTRLGIGSTGNVLTVAGGVPTWAAPAGGATNYTLINTGGTDLTGAATITISGISGKNQLFVIIEGGSSASASSNFYVRFNSDNTNIYSQMNAIAIAGGTVTNDYVFSNDRIYFGALSTSSTSVISGYFKADGCNSAGVKTTHHSTGATPAGGGSAQLNTGGGTYRGTSTISSMSFTSDAGNWDGGKVYVYGA